MKVMSAWNARNASDLMIDAARAELAPIEKHGRRVVVDKSVEEHQRLSMQAEENEQGAARGVQ
jgi:hypothetical protein